MTPEILHLIFTAVGLFLGWYVRHNSLGIPAELLGAVKDLHINAQKSTWLGYLNDILGAASQGGGSPPASPAK
jgi:hypothetical protein